MEKRKEERGGEGEESAFGRADERVNRSLLEAALPG